MFGKPIRQVEAADLRALVDSGRREDREVDYKEAVHLGKERENKEFLADVSSFANASGGFLIFGIAEERDDDGKPTGIPKSVDGLAGSNADAVKLQMEQLLKSSIDPRLPGVEIEIVEGFSKGPVLLIHIPASWASPHMVTLGNHARFYSRHSAGKYQLDVRELRAAFAQTADLPKRLSALRLERVGRVISDDVGIALGDGPKLVLHLVPISALDPTSHIDVVAAAGDPIALQPLGASGWDHRFNFDGFMTYSGGGNDSPASSYVQVFRSGIIEAVNTSMLVPFDGNRKMIPSVAYEERILRTAPKYLELLETVGTSAPIFVMVTLTGVKGYQMAVGERHWQPDGRPIDRDVVAPSEALLDGFSDDLATALRPAFDQVWQACGWARSLNYDASGRWRSK